jgi:hypothetical protein
VTWAIAIYTVVISALVVVWQFPSWVQLLYVAIFPLFGTLLLILAAMTTFSDPTDPVVYEHRLAIRLG